MSASVPKRPFWLRLAGPLRKAPKARPNTAATHLQSISPEEAAHLMGRGSVPPKTATALTAADTIAPEISPVATTQATAVTQDLSSRVPWPLLRSTGVYQIEHEKTERALALSTAELVAQVVSTLEDTSASVHAKAATPSRNLAGQLAVIARFNQPTVRSAGLAAAKFSAIKAHATPALVRHRAATASRNGAASLLKAKGDGHSRPQATIIDFSSIRKPHRHGTAKRAA